MKSKLRHRLLGCIKTSYRLESLALKESSTWENEGYNYRHLWTHHIRTLPSLDSAYIAISKAANTSMRNALEHAESELSKIDGDFQSSRTVKDHRITLNEFCNQSPRFFTIVREPVDRFWSAYKNRILERPHGRIVSKIAQFHGLREYTIEHITPEATLDYVEHCRTENMDEHLRPQWACCGFGRINFEYIAKVESLSEDLQKMIELRLIYPNTLAFFGQKNKSAKKVANEVQVKLRSRIEHAYSEDYIKFGYQPSC